MMEFSECGKCGRVKTLEEFWLVREIGWRREYIRDLCSACMSAGDEPGRPDEQDHYDGALRGAATRAGLDWRKLYGEDGKLLPEVVATGTLTISLLPFPDPPPPHVRTCKGCDGVEPDIQFPASPKYGELCTDCKRIDQRARKYGSTVQDFMLMWRTQDAACAICRAPFATFRSAHIDHCHTRGDVRGLLCMGCNLSLGRMRDNADALAAAAAYLRVPAS